MTPGASLPSSIDVRRDIAYAPAEPDDGRGHLLDLYLSGQSEAELRPLLIVSGGSGWGGDDGKSYAADVAPYFLDRGYVVAGVSTRSSAQALFPAQLHDVKAAIRWLRAHSDEYGIDPYRFAIMGDSSGGWTAAMAGVTGNVAALEGTVGVTGPTSTVQAVVDLYGPTDFLQMDRHMLPGAYERFNSRFGLSSCHDDPGSPESRLMGFPIQGRPDEVRRANPITYVGPDTPPFLIAHGQGDPLVPHHQSELLFQALRSAGVPATFYSVPGIGHDKRIVAPPEPEADARSTSPGTGSAGEAGNRPTFETIESFLDMALDTAARARTS